MLVDSHCHLDRLDLSNFDGSLNGVLAAAEKQDIGHFLCVSINLEDYPAMLKIAEEHDQVSASVGLHPNEQGGHDPAVDELVEHARHYLPHLQDEGASEWMGQRPMMADSLPVIGVGAIWWPLRYRCLSCGNRPMMLRLYRSSVSRVVFRFGLFHQSLPWSA